MVCGPIAVDDKLFEGKISFCLITVLMKRVLKERRNVEEGIRKFFWEVFVGGEGGTSVSSVPCRIWFALAT
jgi:hypothetical protein